MHCFHQHSRTTNRAENNGDQSRASDSPLRRPQAEFASLSQYSGGFAGGIIFSILNILTQLGFSTTCVILGGQTLHSINGVLPLAAGVVIVSVCSLAICLYSHSQSMSDSELI